MQFNKYHSNKNNKSLSIQYLTTFVVIFAILITAANCSKKPEMKNGYFTCSMHPQVIAHEPGNCPICSMKLTWVSEQIDDAEIQKSNGMTDGHNGSPNTKHKKIKIATQLITQANIATVAAKRDKMKINLKYSAHVDYNEDPNRLVIISTKYDGWVESLQVSKEGQYLSKGNSIFGIYSPTVLAAKEEYVSTLNAVKSILTAQGKDLTELNNDPTLQAAKQKLRYLDVSQGQITELDKTNKASRLTWYHSPISGVVVKKNILQGAFIKAGQEIIRIANLSHLWVYIHVFEKDLSIIYKGQTVTLKSNAWPEIEFKGKIDLIYPFLDQQTRNIKVRILVANKGGKLKPGMFAEVTTNRILKEEVLQIPESAVILSGQTPYVFVSMGAGSFEIRPISVKLSSNSISVIESGLQENELVVSNGQFLLDSESSLKEELSKGQVGDSH